MRGASEAARRFRPDPDASYKLIYLARRHPGIAAEDFPAAWRAHSRLASTFASSLGTHFRSVHQCRKDPMDHIAAPFDNIYDGSSLLAMRSWADLLAARYHPHALDALARDEERVFAGAVDDWTMAVEETVLRAGVPGGHVILSFLARDPVLDPATFRARSHECAKAFAANDETASRVVWNRVVDAAPAYPFAAVTEIWYSNREAVAMAARTDAVVRLLEQRGVAEAGRSVHLVCRLNLAKAAGGAPADRRGD